MAGISDSQRDVAIGTTGLSLTVIFGLLQYLQLDIPTWVTLIGIAIGVLILGFGAGLAVGSRGGSNRDLRTLAPPGSTYLRLHIYSDYRLPSQLDSANIFRWHYFRTYAVIVSAAGERRESIGTLLYVAFDREVSVDTLTVNSPDIKLPLFEVKEFNQRFAIIYFSEMLPDGTLEIAVRS